MAEPPLGPKRVRDQAIAAGYTTEVQHGAKDGSQAWSVISKKENRGFAALWTQLDGSGVKSVGLFTWGPGQGATSIKLADLRKWLAQPS